MFKRILTPTDGSACREAALERGRELARSLGAEVTFPAKLESKPLRWIICVRS